MYGIIPHNLFGLFDVLQDFGAPSEGREMEAWWEDGKLFVSLSMPGFDKGKISILREGNIVTVTAEKETVAHANKKYLVKMLGANKYSQSIELPKNLDTENAEADYVNGVLTMSFRKINESPSKRIELK